MKGFVFEDVYIGKLAKRLDAKFHSINCFYAEVTYGSFNLLARLQFDQTYFTLLAKDDVLKNIAAKQVWSLFYKKSLDSVTIGFWSSVFMFFCKSYQSL